MHGGETVILHNALRDEHRVLEVETVPRHERDAHVLAQRQITHIHGRAVRQNITARNHVARLYNRALILAGVLIRADVLR